MWGLAVFHFSYVNEKCIFQKITITNNVGSNEKKKFNQYFKILLQASILEIETSSDSMIFEDLSVENSTFESTKIFLKRIIIIYCA